MNQLQEVADRLALRALVEQYAKGADNRSPELFGGAFTKDGVLNTSRGEVIGGDAIAALAPKLGRYRATMHMIGNHYVDFVDDDHAKGEQPFRPEPAPRRALHPPCARGEAEIDSRQTRLAAWQTSPPKLGRRAGRRRR